MNHTTFRLAVFASLSMGLARGAATQQPTAPTVERQPVGITSVGQPVIVPTVTLDDVVSLAIKANPTMVSAQGTLRSSAAARRQAYGNWLPTLSASSGASNGSSTVYDPVRGQNITRPAAWSYSAGLSAGLLLFDNGGQRFFQNKQANANFASADAALVEAKFTVTLAAKTAFYDAVAAGELERVRETQVQSTEGQLRIAKEKLAAGSAIRSDTLRATVLVGNARVALLQARANRAATEAALARVIGLDGAVRPQVDAAVMMVAPLDTAAIRAEATEGAPSITRAQAVRRAAEAAVTLRKQDYLPRVTASYSQNRSGAVISSLNSSWSLGVNLSWNLFNGFGRETQLVNALSSRETAIAQEADQRRFVEVQVTQQVANLAAAEAQLMIAQASRGAAEEDLRISRERYRLGASTLVDVLQAQAAHDQTQVDAVNARKAYQVAKANLSALVGREL